MPWLTDTFLEGLKGRIDLADLVGRHVTLKKQGSNWIGLCPFHQEKTPSFHVHPERGFFKCFGCGAKGDAIGFLMQLKGLEFIEAVEELAVGLGMTLPERGPPNPARDEVAERARRQQLFDLLDAANRFFQDQLAKPQGIEARRYLAGRGLDEGLIRRFGLGYAPDAWHAQLDHFGGGAAAGASLERVGLAIPSRQASGEAGPQRWHDRFRNRITFPILDLRGRCVGFGGRAMNPGEPKYINSPETELYRKGQLLYGMAQAQEAIQRSGRVVVVEGYMDRIALAARGLDHCVATLGTALTAEQVTLLWRRSRHVTFCFDGDTAGRQAAWRALERVMDGLEADRRADFLFLSDGQDPDDLVRAKGIDGFVRHLEGAVSLVDFLLETLATGLSPASPEGTAALVHRVRPYLARVADPLLQELYAEAVAKRFGIDPWQVLGRSVTPGEQRRSRRGRRPSTAQAVVAGGRDYERALVGLLLRWPGLLLDHEDEVSRLNLADPLLDRLLREWVRLALRAGAAIEGLDWRSLEDPELALRAREVLAVEDLPLENPGRELEGCLATCVRRKVQRDIRSLEEQARDQGAWTDELLLRLRGHKQELERLDEKKRWSAPAL
ncbi:MAG: DNA primase [Magnetococcales bacterium]|nr:DNA primase [Magnetococcales bacterium]